MESTIISVWTPRSCLSRSARAAALGMPPMPSWMVLPSSTSSAMCPPMARSTGDGDGEGRVGTSCVVLDEQVHAGDVHLRVAEGARAGGGSPPGRPVPAASMTSFS